MDERLKNKELNEQATQGEWIHTNDEWFSYYHCSKCGYKTIVLSDECPSCKATMIQKQLSYKAALSA